MISALMKDCDERGGARGRPPKHTLLLAGAKPRLQAGQAQQWYWGAQGGAALSYAPSPPRNAQPKSFYFSLFQKGQSKSMVTG
jgi:hypothetical protein